MCLNNFEKLLFNVFQIRKHAYSLIILFLFLKKKSLYYFILKTLHVYIVFEIKRILCVFCFWAEENRAVLGFEV